MPSFRIKYLEDEMDTNQEVIEEIIPDGEFNSIEEIRENYGVIYELEEIKNEEEAKEKEINIIKKTNIEKIKDVFDILNVDYEIVSDYEIRVICPAECLPTKKYYDLCDNNNKGQCELLNDEDLGTVTDDGMIYILADDYGELSWVTYTPYECEEEC